jgi:hypothetical protein
VLPTHYTVWPLTVPRSLARIAPIVPAFSARGGLCVRSAIGSPGEVAHVPLSPQATVAPSVPRRVPRRAAVSGRRHNGRIPMGLGARTRAAHGSAGPLRHHVEVAQTNIGRAPQTGLIGKVLMVAAVEARRLEPGSPAGMRL